ncbi:MAG: hypothetical protein R2710_29430 [Acidimicrobiales bacterium]
MVVPVIVVATSGYLGEVIAIVANPAEGSTQTEIVGVVAAGSVDLVGELARRVGVPVAPSLDDLEERSGLARARTSMSDGSDSSLPVARSPTEPKHCRTFTTARRSFTPTPRSGHGSSWGWHHRVAGCADHGERHRRPGLPCPHRRC